MSVGQHGGAAQAPLKERLRAWWKGVDTPVAVQRPPAKGAASRVVPLQKDLVEPLAAWETPAMRIAQLAWGEGCSKPGGAEHLLELASPLGLDATKSMMEFGVGLGGGTRALRSASGVWIAGYETDPELARAARQLSGLARQDKGVDITCCSAQEFAPRQGSYDCVLSTDTLYQIDKKEDVLIKLENGLKPRGQFLITDYVLGPGIAANDQRLKTLAPATAVFWPASTYARHFRDRNLDLRVSEDITAAYRKLVLDGCKRFSEGGPKVIANAKAYPEAIAAFLDQWAARVSAFESGLLKVMRFSALKLSNIKLMSDW